MYCDRCGPTVGERDKHGLRNFLSIPVSGATAKFERWHCRSCGGPVTETRSVSEAERQRREENARADFARRTEGTFDVVVTVPAGVVDELRMGRTVADLSRTEVRKVRRLMKHWQVTGGVPGTVCAATTEDGAAKLVALFERLGAEVNLVEAQARTAEEGDDDSQALPTNGEATAGNAEPSGSAASADVLEQVRKLGELREAGILTEEEFESKKADLLRRL